MPDIFDPADDGGYSGDDGAADDGTDVGPTDDAGDPGYSDSDAWAISPDQTGDDGTNYDADFDCAFSCDGDSCGGCAGCDSGPSCECFYECDPYGS
jgi:hypothetical protein